MHITRIVMATMLCIIGLPLGVQAQVQPPGDQRDRLTKGELLREAPVSLGLVHNDYFMPMAPSADALHELSGVFTVPETHIFSVDGGFPSFSAEFFVYKGYLVPVQRDIIPGNTGKWNIILSPGRVWSDPADDGWSRASLPFVLTGRIWNDSHNGIASFLYNDKEVSDLRVQIVQEAAPGNQFDGWAQLPFSYAPGPLDNRLALDQRFADELEQGIPIRPFSDLEDDPDLLAGFDGPAQDITVSSLVIDGVLYAEPCRTRYGDFPYCRYMRHGVYSMTKSMGAALSLLRLAEKYGDDVFSLKITDYLNVTAEHDGWDMVTFAHALNMATGIGDGAHNREPVWLGFSSDEASKVRERVAVAISEESKLLAAFAAGNYPWGPGDVGRYNSTHTFVLAAAMDAFLKSQEGPDANLWDMIIAEVLEPIGVFHAPLMHTREPDGGRGVPIMGWGYYPTLGEIAKIAGLLQNGGAHGGQQLLSATMLHDVFRKPTDPGLPADWENEFGRYRYQMSFWYMPFLGGGGCFTWVPEMSGYGGNLVTLMPNGMTGIRLADAYRGSPGQYEAEGMARLADSLEPFCD
jgi:CubicO group peptidase (beta-lactamase class C family)